MAGLLGIEPLAGKNTTYEDAMMKNRMKYRMTDRISLLLSNCLILFAIYYFLMPAPAYGYFDLGTGTYMVQMLLGFGAAVWLSMRTSWIRIGRVRKPKTADGAPTEAATPGSGESKAEPQDGAGATGDKP
ncbi:MAG: hypothetical protein JST01_15920 [Cyanobacteria bacterium SZAS TMP-1]|nr:hypothetical protein [Cyanobacteria bacterium SZAS TMP-1]